MPRKCSICHHDRRGEIDAALIEGVPLRNIAARFEVSTGALSRHQKDHIPKALSRAQEAGEVTRGDDLLSQLRELQGRTLRLLQAAEMEGDTRTALSGVREARANLELLGKLAGELQDGPAINVHLSAEWVEVRAVLMGALQDYPDARQAVAYRLREVEGGDS